YWNAFSNGGQVLMPLDSYAWSEQYGWIQDRFGISWQVYLAKERWGDQKIIPTLMFCAQQQGKAEEAIAFYTSVFKNTEVSNISRYPEGSFKGQIQHARLVLNDYELMAMDSGVPQNFTFNEGISMVLTCDTQ